GMKSSEFCEKLVQEEKVAVVPGTAFGEQGEGFVRISYATSMETIQEALKRMGRFVEKYRK
ncbi:aminotransferase class I/II-fold pyridoxal phosphate-dependent enzyme, partial [Megasphaera massiliensis]